MFYVQVNWYIVALNYDSDNELGLLMHELTHAYQDYCLRKSTGKTLKQKLEDSGYFKNNGNYIELDPNN